MITRRTMFGALAGTTLLTVPGVLRAFEFPAEPMTIQIWWHEFGPLTAYMGELIAAYQGLHPNVRIESVVVSSGDLNQKLTVALATGTGPHIIDNDASFFGLYYSKGLLDPLNLDVFGVADYQGIQDLYTPGGLDAATFDGKVYALPFQANSMSLFINNKEFVAAGLDPVADAPKTWEDMIALGPKLKITEGNRTVQKAFDFPYHSPRWELQLFQPLVEQFGGRLLAEDGVTVSANSEAAVKALTLWRDVTRVTGDPRTTMNVSSAPNQDFLDGRTAMWTTGPWATPQIHKSAIGEDFTVVSYPQLDPQNPHTILYGFMWAVNSSKPDLEKAVAWDFIRFMLSKPEEWISKVGFLQPLKGVTETEVAQNFPFFAVHMKDIESGSWYVRSEFTNEISQAIGRAIERTVYDDVDPKASLDQAQSEIERAIR
ncbi:MAG: ABC transporter substrate-binding protein [Paracoccaceae bacterium]